MEVERLEVEVEGAVVDSVSMEERDEVEVSPSRVL